MFFQLVECLDRRIQIGDFEDAAWQLREIKALAQLIGILPADFLD